MASVYIEPVGRSGYELTLMGEPEYSESVNGGYTTARIACVLTRDRDRILDARVRIFPAKGTPWIGRVANVRQEGSTAELTCTGPQADLARFRREVFYCHTAFSEWRERAGLNRDQRIRMAQTENGWSGDWASGTTYAAGSMNGIILDIPTTNACRLVFGWTRFNQTDYRYLVYASATPDNSGGGAWGAPISTQEVGSGGTSGTATVDVNKTGVKQLLLALSNAIQVTPGANTSYHVSGIQVYGVSGITSVTAPAVIGNVCDNLPTWVMPSGIEARRWIDPDATTIEPLTFGAESSELDIIEEALSYRDFDFAFRSKLIGGAYEPVPVYSARSTAPSYQLFPDMPGMLDLTGDDITAMSSAVRVLFADAGGRTRHVDVTETSEDNKLVTIARAKMDVIQASTQSAATATLVGQRYLAQRRGIRVAGTATIEGPISDMAGAHVLPCELEAGRYIRLHGTPYGTVDSRIVEVTKVGDSYARVNLDNTSTSLDTELALLTKRR